MIDHSCILLIRYGLCFWEIYISSVAVPMQLLSASFLKWHRPYMTWNKDHRMCNCVVTQQSGREIGGSTIKQNRGIVPGRKREQKRKYSFKCWNKIRKQSRHCQCSRPEQKSCGKGQITETYSLMISRILKWTVSELDHWARWVNWTDWIDWTR